MNMIVKAEIFEAVNFVCLIVIQQVGEIHLHHLRDFVQILTKKKGRKKKTDEIMVYK